MLFNILAEEGGKTNNWTSYILIILVVVVLVGFFVWSAISNKKKQKQFNDTINAIKPGSKVKTIGGICGTVVSIDGEENTFVLKTGEEGSECYIKFDKQAIYQTDAKPEPAQEEAPIVLETVPELSDASESALEAVGEDAAHEAETTGDEPSQPETEASIDNPFETEHVPALRTLKNGETIELLETKAFGALTARYYACASGTIENGAWTECLEIATPPEAVETSVPEGLSFEPFSACANSGGTQILLCDYDPETGLPPVYYLYEDGKLDELNLNDGVPVNPECIRWYSDWELVYDIETAGGHLTTYLYDTVFGTETAALTDYLPYPFEASDGVGTERWILCGDHRGLRLTLGGGVSVRLLPDGQDTPIEGLKLPLDRSFSCVYLPSMLAVYYEQNKDGAIEVFGFIDCRGDGHFLNRALLDGMYDLTPQIPDPRTLVLPVKDNVGNEGLCVYQYFTP